MSQPQTPRKQAAPATAPAAPPDDFLGRLQQIMIELGNSGEVAALVAAELQKEWGGDRPYIRMTGEASRRQMSLRNAAIVRDYRRGESPALLGRRYGISAGRVCQIVAQGSV